MLIDTEPTTFAEDKGKEIEDRLSLSQKFSVAMKEGEVKRYNVSMKIRKIESMMVTG